MFTVLSPLNALPVTAKEDYSNAMISFHVATKISVHYK